MGNILAICLQQLSHLIGTYKNINYQKNENLCFVITFVNIDIFIFGWQRRLARNKIRR